MEITVYKDLLSRRYDLAETPSIRRLQALFKEVYLQWRLNPSHLFLSKHDHCALTHELISSPVVHTMSPVTLKHTFGIDMQDPSQPTQLIAGLTNFTTGRMVRVASLPDLENGSVIIGFFE